jgi:hypothetical protein
VGPGGVVALMMGTMAAQADTGCLRALRPATAGAIAVQDDFEAAPCGGASAALGYDRAARVARLRRDVAAGDVVRGALSALSAVRPGQKLILQAHVGPVVVERQVEVALPARTGERVVVRGADGRIFSAPAPTGANP